MALDNSLRLSDYTIPIALEAEPGKILLVHGYTGAIDVVDSELWQQLRNYPEQNDFTSEEIDTLSKRGYLTAKTPEEEQGYVVRFAEKLHASRLKLHKSFGFVVTYNCNFRCPYCFENAISKHGTAWSGQTMTPELVDRAFEAMLEIEPRKELHRKAILLYGGEPLLRENHDVVKYIVEKGVEAGYRFNVITNGYDLDYYEDLLTTKNFVDFQISIDGWREYHNRRKYHFNEGGSFDKVMANIGLLLKHEIRVSVRVNTDRNNFNDLTRLSQYFKEIGYSENPLFNMYAANVDEIKGVNKTKSLRYMGKEEFRANINSSLSGIRHSREERIYKSFNIYFTNRKRLSFVADACSGQTGTHLFAPDGGIYTCLETVGKKQHCIGYYNPAIEWTEARARWFGKHVGNSDNCLGCKFALFCGGNCAIKEFEGNIETQLCIRNSSLLNDAVNRAYSDFINYKKN